ncbi:MAG: oligosaccharide flippase family protein [Dehalococcoidia bacterium]
MSKSPPKGDPMTETLRSDPSASADLAEAPGGRLQLGFLGQINAVFLSYVGSAALTFGSAVLVARALGPEGRGIYGLFLLSASIAQAMLGLGLGVSAVYHLGKRTYSLPRVVANAQQVTFASAVVSVLLVLLAWPVLGQTLLDHDTPYWLFAFAVPLFLNYNLLTTILQGASRFLAMNAVILVQPLVLFGLLAVGVIVGDVDTKAALVFWCIATLVASLLALALLARDGLRVGELLRVDGSSLREQVRFGMQGQVGNLIQLLNYRLDQYIVLLFVSTAGVGIYAVSVTVSQTIWFFANAVAAVLLPRLTATDKAEAARTTPLVCRNTLLVSVLAAGALAAFSPWLIEGLFSKDFSSAVVPLLWLLPGTVALAGSKILTSYIFSQGRPLTNSLITAAALAVTLVADFALIPPLGVTGAAIASSIAYSVHFALSLVAYRNLSGGSMWEAVVVRGDDLRRYVDAARERLAPART